MSKASHRPTREGRKEKEEWKTIHRQRYRKMREKQIAEGTEPPQRPAQPNHKSSYADIEAELLARQEGVLEHWKAYRRFLPSLVEQFAKIPDPRNLETVSHQETVLLLYGMFMFVFQITSRREANKVLSAPIFLRNMQTLFPELESMPHGDTVCRFLEGIDPIEIEAALVALVKDMIHTKKLRRWIHKKIGYVIAIDGTQKWTGDHPWADELQERRVQTQDGERIIYSVYVLEAMLVLDNGIRLPLVSEFLTYPDGCAADEKQDCELKAFYRLAKRLKGYFPKLPITLLLDGLFPCGPVFELCRGYNWDFMIVLQDDSLKQLWENARGVARLNPVHRKCNVRGDRRQSFWWANDLEYYYKPNESKKQVVHLVSCEEVWEELDDDHKPKTESANYAWVCSRSLSFNDVDMRCNDVARRRWDIETMFYDEKRRGYQYEHTYAYDWNAMRGYHYLMRLAHFINTLAFHTVALEQQVAQRGVRSFIEWLRTTYAVLVLDENIIRICWDRPFQLRIA